jgi:hypothetical protein
VNDDSIRAGLARFQNLQEAPKLRTRIAELKEVLAEKEREKKAIIQNHAQEVNKLKNRIHQQVTNIQGLELKVDELESIKIRVGKEKLTLREFDKRAKKKVKKEMQEEVVSKANALAKIKTPLFVRAEILKFPHNCMDETRDLIESRAISLRDEYLANPANWSPEFKSWIYKYIDARVEEKKNYCFWEEVHKEAEFEVDHRLPNAWARFLSNYATNFIQNTFQNQLRRLSTPITLYCPKCQGSHQITLTPNEMSILIRNRLISFPCSYCRGWFKPKISISLGELFWLIENGDLKPRKLPVYRAITLRAKSVESSKAKKSPA